MESKGKGYEYETTAEPSALASPCKVKPAPARADHRALAVDSRSRSAMSSPDGTTPGLEPGPAGDSTASSDPVNGVASAASTSQQDVHDEAWRHDADGRAPTPAPAAHREELKDGPTSIEDRCLECCVYYGVMCCQCTIL